jgi:prepilin-type N-terminal cleavage/methylation domain-containing protein
MLQNAIQYRFSSSKKGFTLIEVIFSMTVFFIIVSIVLGLYRQMIQIKNDINAKQILIQ